MSNGESTLQADLRTQAAEIDQNTGRIQRFGALDDEYRWLHEGAALVDRDYAGVLEIAGADRASWLHNLTTNQVKNLGRNEGVYAFVLNAQGRIQFDLQILNRGETLWCVVNRSLVEPAIKHLDRYLITEDVTIVDRSADLARLGLSGARVPAVLDPYGLGHAGAMASLGVAPCSIDGADVIAVRNDFCGVIGVDLWVARARAGLVWSELSRADREPRAIPIGDAAVEIARIESGLPCTLRELTGDVLPAETGQFDRAVSYTKGCYLGQEIVERMRSRGVVARVLSGLAFEGQDSPPIGADVLTEEGSTIGIITSACRSLGRGVPIGLGYLKTGMNEPGRMIRVAFQYAGGTREIAGTIVRLPFVGDPSP